MYLSVFRSPILGPVISPVFLERLFYLSLSFAKYFYLSDMMNSEWSGTWKTSHYFFLPKGKITRWQQDHVQNVIIFMKYSIRVSFSQTIWKWDYDILGKLLPPVPSNPLTFRQLSLKTSRVMSKIFIP